MDVLVLWHVTGVTMDLVTKTSNASVEESDGCRQQCQLVVLLRCTFLRALRNGNARTRTLE